MRWKPLILCVDDTPSWLEGQKMLLEENGYRVLTATNGTDALQAFVSHSVDVVLLDYHMPGMNGGVAAALMKDYKPDVPVALWSSDECLPTTDFKAVDCFYRSRSQSALCWKKSITWSASGFCSGPSVGRGKRRHETNH